MSRQRGASVFYSNLAIATMATVKAIYGLAGRQCQGFLTSIFTLMGFEFPVPDHSTLSRRIGKLSGKLSIGLPVLPATGARHVVVDSTGVKVYGEGEWKTSSKSPPMEHMTIAIATRKLPSAEPDL